MQTLSDQEKKVLKIIKESEQQLTPEEITAEINRRYGAGLAGAGYSDIYGKIREAGIYGY